MHSQLQRLSVNHIKYLLWRNLFLALLGSFLLPHCSQTDYPEATLTFSWSGPTDLSGHCFLSSHQIADRFSDEQLLGLKSLVAFASNAEPLCSKVGKSNCTIHSLYSSNMNFCYQNSSGQLFGEEWHITIENQPLLISEFKDQFEQLARGQVGKAKSGLNEITRFDFDQYAVGFYWTPDDKPFQIFLDQAKRAQSIVIYADVPLDDKSWLNDPRLIARTSHIFTSINSRRQLTHRNFSGLIDKIRESENIPLNLVCLNCEAAQAQWFLFSGPVSSKIDYGLTEYMITLPGIALNKLDYKAQFKSPLLEQAGLSDQVKISEILWQGSKRNDGQINFRDEFLELINLGNLPVSISGWSFHCTKASGKISSVVRFPLGEMIPPRSTFTVKKLCKSHLFKPDWCNYKLSIPNDAKSCTLYDNLSQEIHSFENLELSKQSVFKSVVLDINSTDQWQLNQGHDQPDHLLNGDYRQFTVASPGYHSF